ncbi:heme exporter protein CcmD [Marinobacter fonticola]|uniref:heme exporter protein CcmD n=1 Tax=Marinobacter fonticola TaxID=2603215 RepID=UPI0011E7E44F|nr:heme exporter protein CcmD [Marinobacter fonticola]
MAFDSLQSFWVMDGHGPYVWTCYAVFLAAMIGLVIWSLSQRRQVIARQRWQQRLAQRQASTHSRSTKSTA